MKIPYILQLFEKEILPNLNDEKISDLETKLFMDYDEDVLSLF
jgi:hypothetical protein